jgi:hypothetical protein
MKSISMLFCGLILLAANAGAQTSFSSSVSLMPSPFAVSAPPSILNLSGASATVQPEPVSFAAFPPTMPAEPAPQGVQGVFVKYDYDVSVGYTFMRFYEVPGDTLNGNGFNVSGVYWYRDWFGPDAEFFAVYSRQTNVNSWVAVAGAGPRVRWVRPRGLPVRCRRRRDALLWDLPNQPEGFCGNRLQVLVFAFEFGWTRNRTARCLPASSARQSRLRPKPGALLSS